MTSSPFCNGSERTNTSGTGFADYNHFLRLFLPYLLVASCSFVCLCNAVFLFKLKACKSGLKANRFDVYFILLSLVEWVNSFLTAFFAGLAIGNADSVTTRDAVSLFLFARLLTLIQFTPFLLNRFYSSKFPSQSKFALAFPLFPANSVSTKTFWIWWTLSLLFGMSAEVLVPILGNNAYYSCFYVINDW